MTSRDWLLRAVIVFAFLAVAACGAAIALVTSAQPWAAIMFAPYLAAVAAVIIKARNDWPR